MIDGVIQPLPALISSAEERRARRWLARLKRDLRAQGWGVTHRYEANPPLLVVFSERARHVGESVTVFRGPVEWWFMTCTGHGLAPCARVDAAAAEMRTFMEPLVAAALRPPALIRCASGHPRGPTATTRDPREDHL